MIIEQFICRSDNYGVILHDEKSKSTAIIDAPDGQVIHKILQSKGWNLDFIFITHHHFDHVAGVLPLKQHYNAKVVAPLKEQDKIQNVDIWVKEGDFSDFTKESFANYSIKILETPGHTLGEVSYYFPQQEIVFTGDILFSLGCGRLFEGTAKMLLESLLKLRQLPKNTQIYCGHEYSESNAQFALSLEPNNLALQQRAKEIFTLTKAQKATLPISMERELATNPFLRFDNEILRQNLVLQHNLPKEIVKNEEILAFIRRLKDNFKG